MNKKHDYKYIDHSLTGLLDDTSIDKEVWDSKMYDNYKKCKKTCDNKTSNDKTSDDTKSSSDSSFYPVCSNSICVVPRMDKTTIILKGKGRIDNGEVEPEEPEVPEVPEDPAEENGNIEFNLFIGKKFSKCVGEICLVDYDNEVFISSKNLKCFFKSSAFKAVAIFQVENLNGSTREIAVFINTPICGIPASLFVYAPPIFGQEELLLGGSVIEGTIEFIAAEENDDMH